MPRGRSFILVSFNIFINDLEEGVNSTLIIITSDAKLGFGDAPEKGTLKGPGRRWTQLGKGERYPGKKITAHGRGENKAFRSSEAERQGSLLKSFLEQPKIFINKPKGIKFTTRRWHQKIRSKQAGGREGRRIALIWIINQGAGGS